MEMVYCALATGVPFDDILGATREDEHTDDKKDSYQCPEKGHENNATPIFKDSGEDQIAVERNPSFLDLSTVCERSTNVERVSSY